MSILCIMFSFDFLYLDTILFILIHHFAGQKIWLDTIAIFFAQYSEYVLYVGLLLLIIWRRNWFQYIAISLLAAIFARFGATELIRIFYDRPRPFEVLDVYQLVWHSGGYSFPSGHTAFYFALAWALFLWNKRIGIFFLIAALAIGISRVFVGVHYPGDILAGIFIGVLCAGAVYYLLRLREI